MKEDLSELLKLAYNNNRVRNIEEAFEEFPVEKEWHKGKVENVLNEDCEQYEYYNVGDIVFVSVYTYADGKIGSNHVFVIIDRNNTAIPIEYIGMIISSQVSKVRFKSNKLIKKDNKNNLSKDSIIKTDVIYKLMNKQILFKIGELENIEEYRQYLYNVLKDNN